MLQWFRDRGAERSTWLGLGAAASALGLNVAPEQVNAVATIAVTVAGLLAAVLPTKK